jgi:hypothetical protein
VTGECERRAERQQRQQRIEPPDRRAVRANYLSAQRGNKRREQQQKEFHLMSQATELFHVNGLKRILDLVNQNLHHQKPHQHVQKNAEFDNQRNPIGPTAGFSICESLQMLALTPTRVKPVLRRTGL